MEIAGLVLAAGAGRRYGRPKALIPFPGKPLVSLAAETLREAGVLRRLIVLGAAAAEVRDAVPDLPDSIVNADWESGLGSSLRAGLAALDPTPAQAALVLLVDMPGVTAAAVRRIAALAGTEVLAMGGYEDRRGHPVLLGRSHWAGVAASAQGDRGARDYLRAHAAELRIVPIDDVADDRDIDTPESNPYA